MPVDSQKLRKAIPANVIIISGSRDDQTHTNVYDVGDRELPKRDGRVGGKLTPAFCTAMTLPTNLSYKDLLSNMAQSIQLQSHAQVPQISSSRKIQANNNNNNNKSTATKDLFATSMGGGKKRALLIGINYYPGEQGALKHSHANLEQIRSYLLETRQFSEQNIEVLMDTDQISDNVSVQPTKKNILIAMRRLVKASKDSVGDNVAFVYICGHGGRVLPPSKSETLIPVDYQKSGPIQPEELYTNLICPMPSKTKLVCLFDLANSGPLIQLPYMYAHKEDHERAEFYDNAGFDLSSILGLAMFGTAVSVAGGEGGGGGDCCGDIDCGDMCGEVCTIL